jgi:hypothetical protein
VWETRLDVEVAALEGVVFPIADRRGVLLVVAQVVARQLVGQALQFLDGLGFGEVGDGDLGHGRIRRLENGGRLAGGGQRREPPPALWATSPREGRIDAPPLGELSRSD